MRARLAVVVLAALALPASAQAHAFLESSTPANGTSLGRAPHVVSLHFTEPVSAGLAACAAVRRAGQAASRRASAWGPYGT